MKITGAQAIVECLKENQVEVVFGYPGGAILPIYDSLTSPGIHHGLGTMGYGLPAAKGFCYA